jgi:undecaprenyl-diphosphatase
VFDSPDRRNVDSAAYPSEAPQSLGRMDLLQAIVLGIVQGLTEFLPISSTAHLRLVPALLGWPDPGAAVTAVIQLGTLLAVLLYFWRDLLQITVAFFTGIARGKPFEETNAKLAWLIGVGTIPIAVCGLLFKDFIKGGARSLWVIAGSLILLAIILAIAERVASRVKEIDDISWTEGLVVGIAQALALIPGSSRSGTTITAALFAGMTREAAARYSFLLSVPAVLLSGLYELYEIAPELGSMNPLAILVATAVSFVFGYASIAFLLRFLKTHSTFVFVGYRIVLGLVLVALLAAGVVQPM